MRNQNRSYGSPLIVSLLAILTFAGCQAVRQEDGSPPEIESAEPSADAEKPTDTSADTKVAADLSAAGEKSSAGEVSFKDDAGSDAPIPVCLADANWVRSVYAPLSEQAVPLYRWRHVGLEDLLSVPAERRYDLNRTSESPNQVVAANSAIGLARLKTGSPERALVQTVQATELKLPLRLAAAEALSAIDNPPAVAELHGLIDEFARTAAEFRSRYVPEVHAELIRGLARHVEPQSDSRLADGLKSPAAVVRLEAIQAWKNVPAETIPEAAALLYADPDARVRVAALQMLSVSGHPSARQRVNSALTDQEISVRLAAIAALGTLGGEASQVKLQKLLTDGPELVRAAAVAATAELEDWPMVRAAAKDKAWRVRMAVATALTADVSEPGRLLAHKLALDPSLPVQKQMVATLQEWPLELAGPLLLEILGDGGYLARKAAAEQLAARWPAAAAYAVDAPEDTRAEMIATLSEQWGAEFSDINQAVFTAGERDEPQAVAASAEVEAETEMESLPESGEDSPLKLIVPENFDTSSGSEPATATEHSTVSEPVTADETENATETLDQTNADQQDVGIAILERLAAPRLELRRQAAEELIEASKESGLSEAALDRLAELAISENDSLVWRGILVAVEDDARAAAIRLACAALSHPVPELRRRACEHLKAHGDMRQAEALLPGLADRDPSVVRAAVVALGVIGRREYCAALEPLLTASDKTLRVDVAASLARLGESSGPAALERLSYDDEPKIRRLAAEAMGELADPQFTQSLIRLLDDRLAVQRTALEALPRVAGDEAPIARGAQQSAAEQTSQWKAWWEQKNGVLPASASNAMP